MKGRLRSVVGIEWSAVATVWPGRRTPIPRARRPEKACGLVTSWTRWRSTARTAGAPGSWVTTWSVQILSTMVRGAGAVIRRAYQSMWERAGNAEGAARGPLLDESCSGRERPWRDSEPAQTSVRAGPPRVDVRSRRGGRGHGARHYHLSPAPSERAIVARSDTATVKRVRFAFKAAPRIVCVP